MAIASDVEEPTTISTDEGSLTGYPQTSSPQTMDFDQEKVVAFIGEGVEFKGAISYQGSVRIDGRFEGELNTTGMLLVGPKAVISAKVRAGSVISKGKMNGEIFAKDRVQLLATANMDGSVTTPQLAIEEGVIFNATIEMKNAKNR